VTRSLFGTDGPMRWSLPLLVGFAAASSRLAAQQAADLSKLQDEAVQRGREYLQINTTNPPGNENRTMQFFARIFAQEGVPFDTASSAPGRGNIWARLKGGSEPALVLLHHMDVVPADATHWEVDPFSATVKDGEIWGRGALDTKMLGIVELEAFLALHRDKTPLARDVIFMATADEEAGGSYGAAWVVKSHPEAFKGARLLINEGGGGTVADGRQQFGIEVTQKVPLWLKLTAIGTPAHGSTPHVASAVNRLIRALYRLQTHEFAPRVVPAVDAYFKALARNAAPEWKTAFGDMATTVKDPDKVLALQLQNPSFAALTRNTCSITMLEGGNKINVIPPEAHAQLDCRLLPDQNPEGLVEELVAVMNDPAIRVEKLMGFTPAVSSTDTPLYRATANVVHRHFPEANIVPAVETGFTDSHYFRDLGIACYGFAPFLIPVAEEGGVHGNNERISIENVRQGTGMMLELVRAVAANP
jgi:acetylornithine deacetylase/succinyl-diaminopimelate desuccinylase-like protein